LNELGVMISHVLRVLASEDSMMAIAAAKSMQHPEADNPMNMVNVRAKPCRFVRSTTIR
jgi:hypothetical protein